MNQIYLDTARLLTQVAPIVMESGVFAVADLQRMLETNERQFLLSLVKATPEWELLDIAHLKQLPALRWKLTNLDKLAKSSPKKFTEQANALERLLGTT